MPFAFAFLIFYARPFHFFCNVARDALYHRQIHTATLVGSMRIFRVGNKAFCKAIYQLAKLFKYHNGPIGAPQHFFVLENVDELPRKTRELLDVVSGTLYPLMQIRSLSDFFNVGRVPRQRPHGLQRRIKWIGSEIEIVVDTIFISGLDGTTPICNHFFCIKKIGQTEIISLD
ncbi:hypothetical protein LMG22931_05618 [Paraburkholderia nemoris]|nr:hypothetical protein LMG22931_05618 [Paraburkholderia nemoris]